MEIDPVQANTLTRRSRNRTYWRLFLLYVRGLLLYSSSFYSTNETILSCIVADQIILCQRETETSTINSAIGQYINLEDRQVFCHYAVIMPIVPFHELRSHVENCDMREVTFARTYSPFPLLQSPRIYFVYVQVFHHELLEQVISAIQV